MFYWLFYEKLFHYLLAVPRIPVLDLSHGDVGDHRAAAVDRCWVHG